jgi:hypothetical protein
MRKKGAFLFSLLKNNIPLLLFFFFSLFSVTLFYRYIYFMEFADESGNIFVHTFFKKGMTLYQEVYMHHQPMAYIMSSWIQEIKDMPSIAMVIKYHRLFMMGWSFVWGALLIKRFGYPMLFSVIVLETTKLLLVGHMFLSETLVMYPFLYLAGTIFVSRFPLKKYEQIFVSLIIWFIFYQLTPLWPFLFAAFLIFLYRNKSYAQTVFFFTVCGVIITGVILLYSSPSGYIEDTIISNFRDYIPQSHDNAGPKTTLKALLAPVMALRYAPAGKLLPIIQLFSLVFIILSIRGAITRKYWLVGGSVFLLFLSGLRYVNPFEELYGAFHMIPWYAFLVFITFYLGVKWYFTLNKKYRIAGNLALICMLILPLYFASGLLFEKRDHETDLYVNFSSFSDYAAAINIMKAPQDTFFPSPIASLIYWDTDVAPPGRYQFYYGWMDEAPHINASVHQTFKKNPPTFLYCEGCDKLSIAPYLLQYSPLMRDGKRTHIRILKTKVQTITKDQKEKLNFYRFLVQ